MADYSHFGGPSPEWSALEATLPTVPDMAPEELKKVTNSGREDTARSEMKALASKVDLQDHSILARDGTQLEVRTYRSSSIDPKQKLPIYIHFHGGGFFFGTLSSEDATCSRIAVDVEVVVVNVNYRHSPDHVYPTPWYDSEDTLNWAHSQADSFGGKADEIVVGGISAGGHLTAALMQTIQRENSQLRSAIKGQVLMIPLVVHEDCYEPYLGQLKDPSLSSYKENEFAPILPLTRLRFFNKLLFPTSPDAGDRRANPGLASSEEVKGLPPATFGICGLDPLRDEGLLYAKLLQENG